MEKDPSTTKHDTPAIINRTLNHDANGPPRQQPWNYCAAIGSLLYLLFTTRIDLAYSVHQRAQSSADSKRIHKTAVKRAYRCLLATKDCKKDKGSILHPDFGKGFECYEDADFAELWQSEDANSITSALAWSKHIFTYARCPIVWSSKMQTLFALSTTEAKVIALSTIMREVITMMNLLNKLINRGFPISHAKPTIKCRVFENNAAATEIAKNPKMRPWTKHLGIRIHNFRDYVIDGLVDIIYVPTSDPLADALTKAALPRDKFRYLVQQVMGWRHRFARECDIIGLWGICHIHYPILTAAGVPWPSVSCLRVKAPTGANIPKLLT